MEKYFNWPQEFPLNFRGCILFKRFISWLNARIIGQEQKLLRLSEQGLISGQKTEQEARSLSDSTLDKQNCANVTSPGFSHHLDEGQLDVCTKLEQMVVPASNKYQLKMISRPFEVYSLKTQSLDSSEVPTKIAKAQPKIDKARAQLSLDRPLQKCQENPVRNMSGQTVKIPNEGKKKVS